jgi:hypothetical protein
MVEKRGIRRGGGGVGYNGEGTWQLPPGVAVRPRPHPKRAQLRLSARPGGGEMRDSRSWGIALPFLAPGAGCFKGGACMADPACARGHILGESWLSLAPIPRDQAHLALINMSSSHPACLLSMGVSGKYGHCRCRRNCVRSARRRDAGSNFAACHRLRLAFPGGERTTQSISSALYFLRIEGGVVLG